MHASLPSRGELCGGVVVGWGGVARETSSSHAKIDTDRGPSARRQCIGASSAFHSSCTHAPAHRCFTSRKQGQYWIRLGRQRDTTTKPSHDDVLYFHRDRPGIFCSSTSLPMHNRRRDWNDRVRPLPLTHQRDSIQSSTQAVSMVLLFRKSTPDNGSAIKLDKLMPYTLFKWRWWSRFWLSVQFMRQRHTRME